MNEEIPKILGRYQIEKELGRGMMGVVYRALDPDLGRLVALKTIKLAFSIPDADRDAFEKRFMAEARAAAGLSHPGIVVVHDVGRDTATQTVFIALEYLEGQTLADIVGGGTAMDWRQVLEIGEKLAQALQHAHAKGIVHRDIKPANIMLLATGQPRIMDFGIAKLPTSNLTVAGELFGTPSFMSPEQAGGETVDARSDLFSLGCVLYQLLTGRRAFDAGTLPAILMRVMKEDPQPPSRATPGLPPAVDAVIAKALAKSRDARYQTGLQLAEDLRAVLEGKQPRHAADASAAPTVEATHVSIPASPGLATTRLSDMLSVAAGTSVMRAPRPGLGRRGRLLVGSLAAAGVLLAAAGVGVLFLMRSGIGPGPALLPIPGLMAQPAKIDLYLEHSLRNGLLKISVDDALVLEEPLEGQVTKKILGFRQHKGSLRQTLDVPPGERVIRVEVLGENYAASKNIRGSFASGTTRLLRAQVGGWPNRELALSWGS